MAEKVVGLYHDLWDGSNAEPDQRGGDISETTANYSIIEAAVNLAPAEITGEQTDSGGE